MCILAQTRSLQEINCRVNYLRGGGCTNMLLITGVELGRLIACCASTCSCAGFSPFSIRQLLQFDLLEQLSPVGGGGCCWQQRRLACRRP